MIAKNRGKGGGEARPLHNPLNPILYNLIRVDIVLDYFLILIGMRCLLIFISHDVLFFLIDTK